MKKSKIPYKIFWIKEALKIVYFQSFKIYLVELDPQSGSIGIGNPALGA